MKEKKLTIIINKTPKEIFTFTLNPENTPKWIPSIIKEETNEHPTKLGTIYRNVGENGKWNTYTITQFEENQTFTLTLEDKNYHCRYTFIPIPDDATKLEYYEWVDTGKLDDPFSQEFLENLKTLMEKN
jgi:hypothetical protein